MLKKLPSLWCCVILAITCLTPQHIYSQLRIDARNSDETLSLHQHAYIVNVGAKKYSIGELLRSRNQMPFTKVLSENEDLGFTQDNYWVYTTVLNNTDYDLQYYLETARPITDTVELFTESQSGTIAKFISGDNMPFSKRNLNHRKTVFKVLFPANATTQLYLRIKSDGEVVSLPLKLHTADSLLKTAGMEQFVFGIFYGILILAAIIYLFFFFGLRERTFLYYSLYVIFIGLMHLSLDGYFYQYILPNNNYLGLRAVLIFAIISTFLLGRYSQVFLKIKAHDPALNRLFDRVYILVLILMGVLIFIPQALRYCYPAANAIGLMILILIIYALFRLHYLKIKVDPFYTAGISFLVIGFAVFILNNFGQVPTTFLTQNSSKFGTGVEVICLSLSMANLISIIKSEREKYNRLALLRSQEMNELKSYFLSNISHELRTPLNAIMNLTDSISGDNDDEKIQRDCGAIRYSSQTLLSSVNDILDFSKIEKGELVLDRLPFSPAAVFHSIRGSAQMQASQDVELQFATTQLPELLIGDMTRLLQINNNIINNAFKFTKQGQVSVAVSCQVINGLCRLKIVTSDTGIGIPKEKIDSIFDSFSQDSIDNKRKYGGLGLGLYLVKTLVDMQKGTVVVSSTPGRGTVVTLSLDYEIAVPPKPINIIADTSIDLKDRKILVVEDNAINQMVIKMIIKKWQVSGSDYAVNGQEAIEKLQTEHFDIILMDLQMPIMDGYEATIAIRNGHAGEQYRQIPIIAVTADVMEGTKERVTEIGMDGYLSKPLEANLLYETVVRLLSCNEAVQKHV